jgi:hypothetical protein
MRPAQAKISAIVLLVLISSSCSTVKVTRSGRNLNEEIQNISLLSTMIGECRTPDLPIIDAEFFKIKTDKITDQIIDIQKKNIDNYRRIVSESLAENFNCIVLAGTALHAKTGYEVLKQEYHDPIALRTNDDHFPLITIASGDINPFRFIDGDAVDFFRTPSNYEVRIAAIAKILETDVVAVSFSTLNMPYAGPFGLWGYITLETRLYLFSNNGKLISRGCTRSKTRSLSGSNIDDYLAQLDNISLLMDPLLNKMINKLNSN